VLTVSEELEASVRPYTGGAHVRSDVTQRAQQVTATVAATVVGMLVRLHVPPAEGK
jgi:hypothetical protein